MIRNTPYKDIQKVTPKGDQCCKYPCEFSGIQDTKSFRTVFVERLPKLKFELIVSPSFSPSTEVHTLVLPVSHRLKAPICGCISQFHCLASLPSIVRRFSKVSEYA